MLKWLSQHPKNSLYVQLVAVCCILYPHVVMGYAFYPLSIAVLTFNGLLIVVHCIRLVKFIRDSNEKRTPVLPES